jgi:hypothetical protein
MLQALKLEINVITKNIDKLRSQSREISKISNKISRKTDIKKKSAQKTESSIKNKSNDSTNEVNKIVKNEILENSAEYKELLKLHNQIIKMETNMSDIKDSELKLNNLKRNIAALLKTEDENLKGFGVTGLLFQNNKD